MTPSEIHGTYKTTLSMLSNGNIKNAFDNINLLCRELNSASYKQNLDNMQTNYRYLLQYFLDGTPDPERKSVYNKLIAKLFIITSQMRDELLTRNHNNLEFSQKRYFSFKPQYEADDLQRKLNRLNEISELENSGIKDMEREFQIELEFERAIEYLFNYFWLKTEFDSPGMMELFKNVMNDSYKDSTAKAFLVSALTFNIWRTFDEAKLNMLFDACKSNDVPTKQRALVGICFILAKYNRFIPYFPSIRNRLVLIADDNSTAENLQNIIIQIIGTTETDEISKKLQEEIFPELMKIQPLIKEGMGGENPLNSDEWGDINPDWQEMIENSGASEKIQELAEMEISGADVYMSTFAMLKSFPFFSDFSSWFMPFDVRNSAISPLFDNNDKSMLSAFVGSNAMCNSDRYSFCLSILQMPEMQRNMMKSSFSEAAEQMEEMNKDEAILSPNVLAKTISKHYVQDLFRFFKLNPNRGDFANMFKTSLLLHRSYLFNLLSMGDDIKKNIAEFYFSKKLYPQAIELFAELEKEGDFSAGLYQKMGYAYQQNSQLLLALEAYKKADLIKPDDFWTNRKIALCYRLMGDAENALKTYRHCDYIKPGNLSIQLQTVNCLSELNRHDEALKELTKLNNDYGDNIKLLRATTTTAFKAGNMAQSEYFASLLIENSECTGHDFAVAGIISWCMNKNKEAQKRFSHSLKEIDNDWELFVKYFEDEKELLHANGVVDQEIHLILDALNFKREE